MNGIALLVKTDLFEILWDMRINMSYFKYLSEFIDG